MSGVEQQDREAYAMEVERLGDKEYADRVRAGKRDTLTILGMLARHRHEARKAALEEAAGIADREYAGRGWHPAATNAGIGIAEAIRSAVGGEPT